MTTDTIPPLVRRSRLSRLRAGLLALFLPVLTLTLVVTTPTTAQAFTNVGPKTIAGALASPPVRIFSMTPWGRGITLAVGLGLTAYETKDMWFPAVKEWMNPQEETTETTNGGMDWVSSQQVCAGGVPEFQLQGQNAGGLFLNTSCSKVNAKGDYNPGWYVWTHAQCRNTSTSVITKVTKEHPRIIASGTLVTAVGQTWTKTMQLIMPLNGICPDGSLPESLVAETRGANMNSVPAVFVHGLNPIADADYRQTTTMQCKQADGSIVTISDTMVGQPGRVYVPSCSQRVPGSIPWGGTISGGGRDILKFDTDQTLYDQWRDCFGPTGLVCKTEVYVDGQRCTMGSSVCIIWHDIWKAHPERVQCRFGPYDVQTTDCANLRYAYQKAHTVTTTTTADPELDPDAPPKGSPEINPNPQPQPQPNPQPNPNPTPNPTPAPTTGANPETPTAPEPTADGNPSSRSCYGDAWSWNPIDWVYVPVKCALKWAFVPETALSVRVQAIKVKYDGKFPFAFPSYIAGMGSGAGGGCPDWRVLVDGSGSSVDKNVVCDSNFTAAIVGARPFLLAGMLAAAFWPLVRGLFFASVPVIKPTPTGRD